MEEEKLIILNPERLEGETQEEYKFRRKVSNELLKMYRKGKLVHLSKTVYDKILGVKGQTYIKDGEHTKESSKNGEEL